MDILLKNENFGITKVGKVGFSWTTFFFGFFVPLTRGDMKWAAIMFFAAIFTSSLSSIVFSFLYNKLYTQDLVHLGYLPETEEGKSLLLSHGIAMPIKSIQ